MIQHDQEVMVNETLVRQLGITGANSVIGKHIRVKDHDRIVVGVVKDFRSGDLHQSMVPVTLIHHLKDTTIAIHPTFSGTTSKPNEIFGFNA